MQTAQKFWHDPLRSLKITGLGMIFPGGGKAPLPAPMLIKTLEIRAQANGLAPNKRAIKKSNKTDF